MNTRFTNSSPNGELSSKRAHATGSAVALCALLATPRRKIAAAALTAGKNETVLAALSTTLKADTTFLAARYAHALLVNLKTAKGLTKEAWMRRQYHSQLVGERTLIWDVHRLVELTRGYPVQQIPLSRIHELDECFWFGDEPATCRAVTLHAKLIHETDLAYPIILSASGRVMDGMHRVCKALPENSSTVNAVQFTQDPEPDYIDADVEALPYEEP